MNSRHIILNTNWFIVSRYFFHKKNNTPRDVPLFQLSVQKLDTHLFLTFEKHYSNEERAFSYSIFKFSMVIEWFFFRSGKSDPSSSAGKCRLEALEHPREQRTQPHESNILNYWRKRVEKKESIYLYYECFPSFVQTFL